MIKNIIKSTVFKIVGIYNGIFNKKIYMESTIAPIDNNFLDINNKKILYLAPHVDDESIGMGGTIYKIRKNNNTILAFTTDSGGSYTKLTKEELIESRKNEARKVSEYLEIGKLEFLDYPDGKLTCENKNLVKDIVDILKEFKPDIIFTNSLIDYHNDHRETTRSLIRALEEYEFLGDIYLYPINIQYRYGGVNSISILDEQCLKAKKNLYNIFKSQLGMGFSIFEKLDIWRGKYIDKSYAGAEWFIKFNSEELKEFERELFKMNPDFNELSPVSNEVSFAKSLKSEDIERKYFDLVKKVLNKD